MADIPINPSVPVTNGADVTDSNPLPCTIGTAAAPASDIAINPRIWTVNGSIVSATNPLPIVLV